MGSILSVENLTVAFGAFLAVKDLTFEVVEGEILGTIGPNGAGKTTMLNGLIGLVKPAKGRVLFMGSDITNHSPSQRCRLGIGRTYQVPRPFVNMTVFENVLVGAVHGASLSGKQSHAKADEILGLTGLSPKKKLLAGRLDLLDRKRLELARALATNPTVLLLDEVAAGLTEGEVTGLIQTVKEIKASGVTIIWIEHILQTMLEAADRLLCLSAGQMLLCGSPREVLASKEVEEVYLGVEEN
jgi:branched-chain amino acid transport system ATP-binding protein